ncbi:S1 RNA-binding domain-containing protein [Streptococcus pneumoniae]|nr:S1 RNA-binding domain-containing protein [Streptococcus pneumoniae]
MVFRFGVNNWGIILFENLFKLRQLPSATSKQYFELSSSVLSTTSKQCFEQPVASFLVCALIFVEYKGKYSELK